MLIPWLAFTVSRAAIQDFAISGFTHWAFALCAYPVPAGFFFRGGHRAMDATTPAPLRPASLGPISIPSTQPNSTQPL